MYNTRTRNRVLIINLYSMSKSDFDFDAFEGESQETYPFIFVGDKKAGEYAVGKLVAEPTFSPKDPTNTNSSDQWHFVIELEQGTTNSGTREEKTPVEAGKTYTLPLPARKSFENLAGAIRVGDVIAVKFDGQEVSKKNGNKFNNWKVKRRRTPEGDAWEESKNSNKPIDF